MAVLCRFGGWSRCWLMLMVVVCGGALSFWWLVKVLVDADGGGCVRCYSGGGGCGRCGSSGGGCGRSGSGSGVVVVLVVVVVGAGGDGSKEINNTTF